MPGRRAGANSARRRAQLVGLCSMVASGRASSASASHVASPSSTQRRKASGVAVDEVAQPGGSDGGRHAVGGDEAFDVRAECGRSAGGQPRREQGPVVARVGEALVGGGRDGDAVPRTGRAEIERTALAGPRRAGHDEDWCLDAGQVFGRHDGQARIHHDDRVRAQGDGGLERAGPAQGVAGEHDPVGVDDTGEHATTVRGLDDGIEHPTKVADALVDGLDRVERPTGLLAQERVDDRVARMVRGDHDVAVAGEELREVRGHQAEAATAVGVEDHREAPGGRGRPGRGQP